MTSSSRRILITGGSGFIGTNYIDWLRNKGTPTEIMNIDVKPPQIKDHHAHWKQIDLGDSASLDEIFQHFQPNEVVHLAARTDTNSNDLSDYDSNILGTQNLIDAVKRSKSVKRLILTSTQFVKRPGAIPEHDEDFDPHTAYGESKVINERTIRDANLDCTWTIIRPTNIWGPWHPRYPHEFWRVLSKGLYFHPSGKSAVRCYGYVYNVIHQIEEMLQSDTTIVDKKVFYVGDKPIELIEWVNGFSLALTNRKVIVLPRLFIQTLGKTGDLLKWLGVSFPITSSRFESMTTDDVVPMQATIDAIGSPSISLRQGIRDTAQWLKQEGYVNKVYDQ